MDKSVSNFSLQAVIAAFMRGFRKLWWLLIALTVLGGVVLGAASYTSYVPSYTASSTFTVYVDNPVYSGVSAYNAKTAEQMAKTFPYILTSGVLSDIVKEDLGIAVLPVISAEAIEDANLLELKVSGTNPELCKKVLDSVIENYPSVAERVVGPTKLMIVDSTGVPTEPNNQRLWIRPAEKGALIGAALGLVLIFAYGLMKATVMGRDDIQKISNARYLGSLPAVIQKKRSKEEEPVILVNTVNSQNYRDAFRSLASRIDKELKKNGYRTMMITSAIPGEGKSTVSTNLAMMLAKLNNRVVVVDCDLRSPSLYRMFNHQKCKGVTEYLGGTKKLESIIYEIIPEKLDVIFAGKPTNDGAELLGSEKFTALLGTLREKYDVVILDTPPCSMLADAAELAYVSDCAIMVIKQDYASRDSVLNGLNSIQESGAGTIGYIINGYSGGASGHYGYGNGYGYGYGYGYGKGYGYGSKHEHDDTKAVEEKPEVSKVESFEVKSDVAEVKCKPVEVDVVGEKDRSIAEKREIAGKTSKKKMPKEKKPKEKLPEEKKKKSKGGKVLLIIVSVLVGLALLLALTAFVLTQIGKNAMTDDGSNMDVAAAGAEDEGDTIRYKGKLYRYNNRVSSILLMGIDSKQKTEKTQYGNGNQADANVMAVLDPKNGKLTLISISRDSMCEIEVLDSEGNSQGIAKAQLALSYSYGDGAERSCELTTDAVSRLFYDLSIPAYGSIYMDGIAELVDVVGGITISGDDGQQRTLNGEQARNYIRYRAHTVEGNNERMDRQSKVLKALVYKALASAKEDPKSIIDLYGAVKENVTTNLNASKMVYLAQQAAKLRFDGEIMKAPGESVLGAQNHAEYIIDDEALFKMILDTFYIPVEG